MHELKILLNEIGQKDDIEPGKFILPEPDQLFESNLTAEEALLYSYYCYLKSNRKQLPDLATIAQQTGLKKKLAHIIQRALTEKGITYE
jgi:hypothetical protein